MVTNQTEIKGSSLVPYVKTSRLQPRTCIGQSREIEQELLIICQYTQNTISFSREMRETQVKIFSCERWVSFNLFIRPTTLTSSWKLFDYLQNIGTFASLTCQTFTFYCQGNFKTVSSKVLQSTVRFFGAFKFTLRFSGVTNKLLHYTKVQNQFLRLCITWASINFRAHLIPSDSWS